MNLTPITLIATLLFASSPLFAQETSTQAAASTQTSATSTAAKTPTESATAPDESAEPPVSSHEVRGQFGVMIRNYFPELGPILALDPTLLTNAEFMAHYPEVEKFVEAHPHMRRNPQFYVEDFVPAPRRSNALDDFFQAIAVFVSFVFIAFVLAWLVRTFIEQKRWNRLSRTQSEVHNKILDRFSTSDELLAYVKSPAGTKFLESAPIPLREEPAAQRTPLTRILWSIQLGVVVVAAGLGLMLASGRFDAESAQGFFAMGVIALCVGFGFIASAGVSLFLSRRLGLWPGTPSPEPGDEMSR